MEASRIKAIAERALSIALTGVGMMTYTYQNVVGAGLIATGLIMGLWCAWSYYCEWRTKREASAALGVKAGDKEPQIKAALYTAPDPHDIWLHEAIKYAAFHAWNVSTQGGNYVEQLKALYAAIESVRQTAADGRLVIYGRQGFSGPISPVPAEHWLTHEIGPTGKFFVDEPEEVVSKPSGMGGNAGGIWRELKTSRAGVERLFS